MKKTISPLLLLIGLACTCSGQDSVSPYNTRIDSLQSLLDSENLDDSLKVIRLHELARLCFYDLQYENGLVAARQARRLSAKLRYLNGEGLYLRTLNIFHKGNPLENIYNLQTSLFYQRNHLTEISITPFGLTAHNPDPAIKNKQLLKALESFALDEDLEIRGHLFFAVANDFFTLNQSEEAMVYANRAENAFDSIKATVPVFESKLLKLRILIHLGKTVEADSMETSITRLVSHHQDERESAWMCNDLAGHYFWGTNRTALAADYLIRTNHLMERVGDQSFRRSTLENLGAIFAFLEMYPKSREYYQKSLDLGIQINEVPVHAGFYEMFAFTLIALKEFEEAEKNILKAKSLNGGEFKQLDAKGQIQMGKGNYPEAIDNFEKANELFVKEGGSPLGGLWINLYLSQC